MRVRVWAGQRQVATCHLPLDRGSDCCCSCCCPVVVARCVPTAWQIHKHAHTHTHTHVNKEIVAFGCLIIGPTWPARCGLPIGKLIRTFDQANSPL